MGITYYSVYKNSTGNVGIGTISPTVPLDVQCDTGGTGIKLRGRSDNSTALRFYANNATTQQAYIGADDSNIDFLSVATRPIRFFVNSLIQYQINQLGVFSWYDGAGGTRMTLNSTGLGIGTTSPNTPLDVVSTSGANALQIRNRSNNDYGFIIFNNYAGSETSIAQIGAYRTGVNQGSLLLYTGTTEKVRINNDGNVGIGTSSPSAKIELYNGNFKISDGNRIIFGASDPQIYGNSGVLTFRTNSSDRMYLDANGNLGVGITSLVHKIQAAGLISAGDATYNNNSTFIGAILNNDQTNPGLDLRRWNGGGAGTDNHGATYIATNSAGDTLFYNGLIAANTRATNEKMRISVAGNVGIGTTSPLEKLHVLGNIHVQSESDSLGGGGLYLGISNSRNIAIRQTSTNKNFAVDTYNASESWQNRITILNSGGNVGIGTTSPLNKLSVISSNTFSYYNKTDPIATFQGVSPATVLISVDGNTDGYYAELKLGNAQSTYYSYSAYIRGIQGAGIDNYKMEFGTANGSVAATRMTIATNGNVGIGTTSPAALLHLQSSAATTLLRIDNTNSDNDPVILLTDNSNPTGEGLRITYDSSVGDTYFNNIYTASTRAFSFQKGSFGSGTDLLTILNTGNVGIGITSPNAKLDVSGVIRGDAGANYPHSFTNTDAGNTHWTNRGERLLTSNGTNWAGDGRDPIIALVTSGNSNSLNIANSIGLTLHNESTTDNTFSPAILFSNKSNSNSYNTAYAAIIGRKTGQGVDANWSAGELHFYTMPVGAYINNIPAMMINSAGNVGIGTTSPSAPLAIYRASGDTHLSISGTATSFIVLSDGTSNGYLLKNSTSGTGNNALAGALYTYTDNNKAFQHIHAGTPLFTILSGGNVGIGTTTPAYKLDVNGTGRFSGDLTVTGALTTNVGGTSIFIGNQNVTTSNGLRINFHTDADLSYYIGKKAGAWTQPLDINFYTGIRLYASSSYDYGISFWNSNNTTKMMSVGEGDSNVRVANTIYAAAFSGPLTGNVTGTATSISGFNNPTTAATVNTIVYRDGNGHIFGNYILGSYFNASSGNSENPTIGQIWTQNTTDDYLRKSTPAHFRSQVTDGSYPSLTGANASGTWNINITGNISGIAATATTSNGLNSSNSYAMTQLDVVTASTPSLYVRHTGNSPSAIRLLAFSGATYIQSGTSTASTSADLVFSSMGAISEWIRILGSTGNVGIGTASPAYKLDVNGNIHATAFPTSSDIRFKKNITPLENSLEKVKKLQGVRYEWNEFINSVRDGYKLNVPIIGLIAQDVEKIVPEIIELWRLSDDCQDARSIDYPRLIPVLIEAIKEQQAIIENQNQKIENLISRVSALEAK